MQYMVIDHCVEIIPMSITGRQLVLDRSVASDKNQLLLLFFFWQNNTKFRQI